MSYQAIVAHDEQTMDFVQTFPTLEEAIEAATGYRSVMGYPTYRCVVDNENGHEAWSSRTPNARWQRLRERVTAAMKRDSQIGNDYAGERYNTWGAVLDIMKELESEAADGNTHAG